MNTTLDVILWGTDSEEADFISKLIIEKNRELELILGLYDQDSETFQINKTA